MATAQAAVVVVVAAGCSGAGVAAGSGVVAAGSGSVLSLQAPQNQCLPIALAGPLIYTQHLLIESTLKTCPDFLPWTCLNLAFLRGIQWEDNGLICKFPPAY